jgi:hypothetical protein
MERNEIRHISISEQLFLGFLDFAKKVKQQSEEIGVKFTPEELAEVFNNSFSGKIRANFFLHIGDINRIIDGIQLIYDDLSELRKDKFSLKGNPIIRSELLFQCFFNEFFRIRETSKIFIKLLQNESVLTKKSKEQFIDFYFTAFDLAYEIRNSFVHKGTRFKDDEDSIPLETNFFDGLQPSEREKFISLIDESNTRENTVEIQCAIYMKFINYIMKTYIEFQELLNGFYADLIVLYEEKVLTITVDHNIN